MKQEQVDNFKRWFDKYVSGFYGDDEFVNANIRLKEDHSRRVCDEMRYLTQKLGSAGNSRRIADVIAIFHDIGRFEQFATYRTYRDATSVNHASFGVQVLRKQKVLDGLESDERQIIEKAIEYHNMIELPENLDGDLSFFCELIRDADKLDIYYIIVEYYGNYEQDPEGFKLEVELPDEPAYTKRVLQKLLSGELIDYKELQTWNDMKLYQLSWVYDVNFTDTFRKIKKRNYLEMIVDFLPETEDIKKAKEKVLDYVDQRIFKCG